MPPQMPPQQPPQSPEQEQGGAGGGAQQLVEGIHSDLMKLVEMVGQAEPAMAQEFSAVADAFQAAVQKLLGGGGQQQQQPAPGQSAQGPGAVPM